MSSDFFLFSSGKMTEHFDINYSIVIFFKHLLLKKKQNKLSCYISAFQNSFHYFFLNI